MPLPKGVRITGQTWEIYDWKLYMSNPEAQKQLKALKELAGKLKVSPRPSKP